MTNRRLLESEWVKNMHGQPCLTESRSSADTLNLLGAASHRRECSAAAAPPSLAHPSSLSSSSSSQAHHHTLLGFFRVQPRPVKHYCAPVQKQCHAFFVVREEEESLLLLCLLLEAAALAPEYRFQYSGTPIRWTGRLARFLCKAYHCIITP
jgi:hypothetical protein